jgi:hypothetical protein
MNKAGADGAKILKTATCPNSWRINDTRMRKTITQRRATTSRPADFVPHQAPAASARGHPSRLSIIVRAWISARVLPGSRAADSVVGNG